jgi:hypothetical protein
VIIDFGRTCARYRPMLVGFVDRSEVKPETAAALRHLDRCERCTEAVESILLTVTALRRLADEVELAEPQADAWPRLRARLARPSRRRAFVMSPIAGLAMSFAIVGVLVLPFRLGAERLAESARPTGAPATEAGAIEERIELAYAASSRRALTSETADTNASGATSFGSVPSTIPPEIWQVRKEVHSTKPSARPVEPI